MMWFTADTHFGDDSIIRHTGRPFGSTAEMGTALIDAINEAVAPDDLLYVIGDFAYRCTAEQAAALRRRIACKRVHLVRGNHDERWSAGPHADVFESEQDYLEIKPGFAKGHRLVLFHYPMLSWNGKFREAIHLHGHIHSQGARYNERNRSRGILRYDVGVDANGYRPVSRDEILAFFRGVEPRMTDGV